MTRRGEAALGLSPLAWCLAAMLLSVALVAVAYPGVVVAPGLPIHYAGDALEMYKRAEVVRSAPGCVGEPRLAAPWGETHVDFPYMSLVQCALYELAGWSGHGITAANLVYFAHFPLIVLAAFWVFGRFGIAAPFAALAAILFAFQPFHLLRGIAHVNLANYLQVPFVALVALQCYRLTRATPAVPGPLLDRFLVLGAVLASTGSIYFAAYAIIAGAAGTLAAVRPGTATRALRRVAAVTGIVVAVALVNDLPHLLQLLTDPPRSVGVRQPQETEIYGLKLVQMLLPSPQHPWPPLAALAQSYAARFPLVNENATASLGAVASAGFVGLLVVALRPALARAGALVPLAATQLALFLFATVGGGVTALAMLAPVPLRAHNRASIVIAFLALAAVALMLQNWAQKRALGPVRIGLLVAATAVFGLWDQGALLRRDDPRAARTAQADRAFFARVEEALAPGVAVFQWPHTGYPEVAPQYPDGAYAPFRAYLATDGLRFSFGATRDRTHHAILAEAAARRGAEFVSVASGLGFRAVLVDRSATAPAADVWEPALRAVVGSPALESPDGRFALYRLPDSPATTPIGLAVVGEGFFGWEGNADAGRWNWAGRCGDVAVHLPAAVQGQVRLSLRMETYGARTLAIAVEGRERARATFVHGERRDVLVDVEPAAGLRHVRICSEEPAIQPKRDSRRLAFRVFALDVVLDGARR